MIRWKAAPFVIFIIATDFFGRGSRLLRGTTRGLRGNLRILRVFILGFKRKTGGAKIERRPHAVPFLNRKADEEHQENQEQREERHSFFPFASSSCDTPIVPLENLEMSEPTRIIPSCIILLRMQIQV